MIQIKNGNLLYAEGIIVHGCNCQGVMGSGVAKQIKDYYPEAYHAYKTSELKLGNISIAQITPTKHIINACTQEYYGTTKKFVSYDAIEECFKKITEAYKYSNLNTICFPKIGAGYGGGNWNIISTIIDETVPGNFTKVLYDFK